MSLNKNKISSILFIFPSLLITTLLFIVPIFYAVYISLHSGNLQDLEFVALDNYRRLFIDQTYKKTWINSLQFVAIIIPLMFIVSVLIAVALHQIKSNRIKSLVSSIFYLPCITSPVAYTLFYKQLAYSDGILSKIITSLGIVQEGFNILQNEITSKIYISLICVWAWSGFYIIIIYSAIERVDGNLYVAARLDGANTFNIYRKIILPIIRPVLLLVIALSICSTFQIYIEVALITKGGPNESTYTLALYLYRKVFTYVSNYGYSSAIGITILIINTIFSIIVFKVRERE